MSKKKKVLNMNVSKEDRAIIYKIAVRGVNLAKEAGYTRDLLTMEMDIIACHLNGNPLDLEGLLDAENGDFGHDVFGIQRHIDRRTGELQDCFVPRMSQREQEVTYQDFKNLFEAIADNLGKQSKGG